MGMVASTRNTDLKSLKRREATMKQPNKFNSQLQQEILGSFQQLVKIPNHPGADQKSAPPPCPAEQPLSLSCRALARHPSLRSGRRPGMTFRGAQASRDPLASLGATKKGLGVTKKGSGRQKRRLWVTHGDLHQFLKQPHSALKCLLKRGSHRSPYIPSVVY